MTPVSPAYPLTLGDQAFTLDPSFKTLKAVQHAFQEDLLTLQARILDMRQDEVSRLLAIGAGVPEDDAGQLVLDLGLTGVEYQLLKARLMAWLYVAMSPKPDRAKKAAEMGELIGKLGRPPTSRGRRTRS